MKPGRSLPFSQDRSNAMYALWASWILCNIAPRHFCTIHFEPSATYALIFQVRVSYNPFSGLTSCIRLLLEKPVVPQLVEKSTVFFVKSEGSLPHSQEPNACPYPEPDPVPRWCLVDFSPQPWYDHANNSPIWWRVLITKALNMLRFPHPSVTCCVTSAPCSHTPVSWNFFYV